MKKYHVLLFFGALLLPLAAHADIKINEVAWMGTAASQYSEWIELYNDSEDPVSLKDWKLNVNGNELLYTLNKSIEPKSYLLVERTTTSAPDAVAGIADEAGTFGSGGLSNAGENLILKDAAGTAVDTLSFAAGWPAGDAESKDTMQWNGEKWSTAPGTPDKENAAQTVVIETVADSGTKSTSEKSTAVPSGTKKAVVSKAITKSKITITPSKNTFAGVSDEFEASAVLADAIKNPEGYYYWNMGDGATYIQPALSSVSHSYEYPGTYTITVAYYSSPTAARPAVQDMVNAIVTEPTAALTVLKNGSALQIANTSGKPMDIGQWPITTMFGIGRLPPLTTIAAKSHIVVTAKMLGLALIRKPTLATPNGTPVSEKGSSKKKT
jgi:hypothetical protein